MEHLSTLSLISPKTDRIFILKTFITCLASDKDVLVKFWTPDTQYINILCFNYCQIGLQRVLNIAYYILLDYMIFDLDPNLS